MDLGLARVMRRSLPAAVVLSIAVGAPAEAVPAFGSCQVEAFIPAVGNDSKSNKKAYPRGYARCSHTLHPTDTRRFTIFLELWEEDTFSDDRIGQIYAPFVVGVANRAYFFPTRIGPPRNPSGAPVNPFDPHPTGYGFSAFSCDHDPEGADELYVKARLRFGPNGGPYGYSPWDRSRTVTHSC
jgi:hypothetical protein